MAPSVTKIFLSALLVAASLQPTFAAPLPGDIISARQLAGEGAAADSILTSTDNGVGYGIENAEDNTAALLSSSGTSSGSSGSGSSSPPPPPPPHKSRRQADKIANGAGAILNAAGQPGAANAVTSNGDSVDGTLTSDAANTGAQIGSTEESTLEGVGKAIPKL
ncbi:hypothetical protein LTR84_001838 [Exophiala bonariae]|uniref:Uncharacterized protein n=1 Tax=Exophiala bonariae TaxID=1690606 RepID=A0AAV9NFA2_9EURO|nr:hypothetical protein LTR84_001838 [Exophiala bonariae]